MKAELESPFSRADVEVLKRSSCYQGFLQVERLSLRCRRYEGGWSQQFQRELLLRHRGVGILLYDPLTDQVLLVEQFRVGCLEDIRNGPWALELVAGLIDSDETEEAVAKRESIEEAGVLVGRVLPVCHYYTSPGGSNEYMAIYCGRFDAATTAGGIFGLAAENENIRTVKMERKAALSAIHSGRINNAMSIIALQWLELNLSWVQSELLDDMQPQAEGIST